MPAEKNHGRNDHDFKQESSHNVYIAKKGRVRAMEFVETLKRVNRRGRHAPLPRKAVEPRCYICVRLRRPVFERLVPAKSNQGRNDRDYNQQSSHDH